MTALPAQVPAAYQYELGSCFRCPRKGTQVARVGEITSEGGETPLHACWECIQELLAMHERSVEPLDTHPRIVQLPQVPRE